MHTQMTLENAKRFITAAHGKGYAIVTFVCSTSNKHFTYKISKARDTEVDRYFVGLLTGPMNTSDYTYIGQILNGKFEATKGTKVSTDSKGFKAFKLGWQIISGNHYRYWFEVWHEGKCGRCGRTLTVKESLEVGIGPECQKIMGIEPVKTIVIEKMDLSQHEWFDGEDFNFQGPDGQWYFGNHYRYEEVWAGSPDVVTIAA